jgi:hypothetical protein
MMNICRCNCGCNSVVEIGCVRYTIAKALTCEVLYYLPVNVIYGNNEGAHLGVGLSGRDRLQKETDREYANITFAAINF